MDKELHSISKFSLFLVLSLVFIIGINLVSGVFTGNAPFKLPIKPASNSNNPPLEIPAIALCGGILCPVNVGCAMGNTIVNSKETDKTHICCVSSDETKAGCEQAEQDTVQSQTEEEVKRTRTTLSTDTEVTLPDNTKKTLPKGTVFSIDPDTKLILPTKTEVVLPSDVELTLPDGTKITLLRGAILSLPPGTVLPMYARLDSGLIEPFKVRLISSIIVITSTRSKAILPEGMIITLPKGTKVPIKTGIQINLGDTTNIVFPDGKNEELPKDTKLQLTPENRFGEVETVKRTKVSAQGNTKIKNTKIKEDKRTKTHNIKDIPGLRDIAASSLLPTIYIEAKSCEQVCNTLSYDYKCFAAYGKDGSVINCKEIPSSKTCKCVLKKVDIASLGE